MFKHIISLIAVFTLLGTSALFAQSTDNSISGDKAAGIIKDSVKWCYKSGEITVEKDRFHLTGTSKISSSLERNDLLPNTSYHIHFEAFFPGSETHSYGVTINPGHNWYFGRIGKGFEVYTTDKGKWGIPNGGSVQAPTDTWVFIDIVNKPDNVQVRVLDSTGNKILDVNFPHDDKGSAAISLGAFWMQSGDDGTVGAWIRNFSLTMNDTSMPPVPEIPVELTKDWTVTGSGPMAYKDGTIWISIDNGRTSTFNSLRVFKNEDYTINFDLLIPSELQNAGEIGLNFSYPSSSVYDLYGWTRSSANSFWQVKLSSDKTIVQTRQKGEMAQSDCPGLTAGKWVRISIINTPRLIKLFADGKLIAERPHDAGPPTTEGINLQVDGSKDTRPNIDRRFVAGIRNLQIINKRTEIPLSMKKVIKSQLEIIKVKGRKLSMAANKKGFI